MEDRSDTESESESLSEAKYENWDVVEKRMEYTRMMRSTWFCTFCIREMQAMFKEFHNWPHISMETKDTFCFPSTNMAEKVRNEIDRDMRTFENQKEIIIIDSVSINEEYDDFNQSISDDEMFLAQVRCSIDRDSDRYDMEANEVRLERQPSDSKLEVEKFNESIPDLIFVWIRASVNLEYDDLVQERWWTWKNYTKIIDFWQPMTLKEFSSSFNDKNEDIEKAKLLESKTPQKLLKNSMPTKNPSWVNSHYLKILLSKDHYISHKIREHISGVRWSIWDNMIKSEMNVVLPPCLDIMHEACFRSEYNFIWIRKTFFSCKKCGLEFFNWIDKFRAHAENAHITRTDFEAGEQRVKKFTLKK